MKLTSAQDLKQELLTQVVAPFAVAARPAGMSRGAGRTRGGRASPETLVLASATELAMGARGLDQVPDVQRSVALGIARDGRQYRLAVRVQRQGLMGSPLVEHLVRQAKGEADVRLIGRLSKRPAAATRRPRKTAGRTRRGGGAAVAAAAAVLAGPWYRGNTRPLLIGASVGHVNVTAGTIGAFVKRGKQTYVLSNNHVLANEDNASAGDVIVQRGIADGGRRTRDRVATLRHWVRLKPLAANFVDAALALPDDPDDIDSARLRGLVGGADRQLVGLGPDFLDEGDVVYKVGRTTGATEGRVTAFELDNVVISYDMGNLRFDNQIEIEGTGTRAFSDGGDSGSLIVDAEMRAVALLFAGGDMGGSNGLGLTYANPIHRVLKDLRATLRTD